MLNQNVVSQGAVLSADKRLAAIAIAFFFGLGLLYVAAFADAAHGMAHDTRHAITVPCH